MLAISGGEIACQRLGRGPAALVAASDRPDLVSKVPYTSWRHLRRYDDINRENLGVNRMGPG